MSDEVKCPICEGVIRQTKITHTIWEFVCSSELSCNFVRIEISANSKPEAIAAFRLATRADKHGIIEKIERYIKEPAAGIKVMASHIKYMIDNNEDPCYNLMPMSKCKLNKNACNKCKDGE